MTLYAAIDLHSSNSVLCVLDETDRIVFSKRLPNDLAKIEQALRSCPGSIKGVAVESTFNWYWLVDGLQVRGGVSRARVRPLVSRQDLTLGVYTGTHQAPSLRQRVSRAIPARNTS